MKKIIKLAVLIALIRYGGDIISRHPEVAGLKERIVLYAEAAAGKIDSWLERRGFSDPVDQNLKSS